MKFLRVVALILAILFLLFCLVGSQRAWFGIIIFIIGLYLQKQYRKGKIQFSKSRYIMTLGLLAAFILTLTSPAVTQPAKQTASEAKGADTAVKADEEKAEEKKAKEAEKKKEEAAAAKLAEQKKQEEARKEAEEKRLEEEAQKQAEQKRLEEEAKKQAEQKRLEEERIKKEQEQAEAAAQEAERKRKEQEAAEAAAAAEQAQATESFDNCTEMRKVHPKGVPSTHPAYESQHDRDKDNWACER
ncbi:excalibur calcium-binding domain-containing protein [Metabacillus indicus]|uniref:excalibur calcium-binding domain-containing protein n=1 Tax=Metabacillus indicus TaxID=246786 RepID=UPI002490D846|nr:excalibur calcium-binding domain-containing protein [Metabacillus indicus]